MGKEYFIEIDNIEKTFKDGTNALKPVDLKIKRGEVLVLLGPSGCGKSTLLRIISGLESPTKGNIYAKGKDITMFSTEKRNIGFVFQQYALFPTMTVWQNIAFGMKLRKKSKEEQKVKVEELLDMMNIKELQNRKPSQLSGGQQQRVAIARALAIEPDILLMDEPLTALDAKLKDKLKIELAELFKKLNITTIYVTHDQSEAMSLAHRIAVMNKGFIEQIGTSREIYNNPKTAFVAQFIGQTNRITGKVMETSGDRRLIFDFCSLRYEGNKKIGESVEAFIRPSDIKITSKGFKVSIEQVMFLGEKIRIFTVHNKHKLYLDTSNDFEGKVGDEIFIEINEDKIIYS